MSIKKIFCQKYKFHRFSYTIKAPLIKGAFSSIELFLFYEARSTTSSTIKLFLFYEACFTTSSSYLIEMLRINSIPIYTQSFNILKFYKPPTRLRISIHAFQVSCFFFSTLFWIRCYLKISCSPFISSSLIFRLNDFFL